MSPCAVVALRGGNLNEFLCDVYDIHLEVAALHKVGQQFATAGNDETVARFSDDVREALKFLKPEDSVVVLADIVGGSPLTTLCSVLDEMGKLDDAIILGGMNLPMAITTAVMKDSLEKDALVQAVLPEAKAAVQQFSAAETEDEDDDEI